MLPGALGIYHSLDMGDILNIMKDMNIAVDDGCDFNYEMDSTLIQKLWYFPKIFRLLRTQSYAYRGYGL